MFSAAELAGFGTVRADGLLALGAAFAIGGTTWDVTHADGTQGTLTGIYVVAQPLRGGSELTNYATPTDPATTGHHLRAALGTDVRVQDVITNGTLRYAVTALAPAEHLVMAALQDLTFFHVADLWRINAATGRRVLTRSGVKVNIYPGGATSFTDTETGQVGGRETFNGNAELGQDIRENDQFRNILMASGVEWFPNARLTVTTVARQPAMLLLRMRNEGA